MSKARALANAGLAVNTTEVIDEAAECSVAATKLVLDLGGVPKRAAKMQALALILLKGGPHWREVADELVEAGDSLGFGVGQEFEQRAVLFIGMATMERRCEQIKYVFNLSSTALCGVDVPAEELEPHVQRLREIAAAPLGGNPCPFAAARPHLQ
jgi:hypothetical protein